MTDKDLLTPSENDLSVQMMNHLLGEGWHDFSIGALDAGAGAILPELFSIVNAALIAVVSAMLVWQIAIGAMETAREGVPLGRQMHSVFGPMRAPAALFLLAPIAKGYSILQVMLLIATYYGVGIADTIWDRFVDYVPERDGVMVKSARYDKQALEQSAAALRNEVNYLVIHEKAGYQLQPRWTWDGNDYGGTWTYGVSVQDNAEALQARMSYGQISFRCGAGRAESTMSGIGQKLNSWWSAAMRTAPAPRPSPVASQGAVCTAMKDAISNMVMGVRDIGRVVLTQYDEGAPPLSSGDLIAVARAYNTALAAARARADADQEAAFDDEIQGFAETAKDLGWASSAFYWWTLTSINEKAQLMHAPTLPDFIFGNQEMLHRVTDGAYKDYQAVVDGYLTRIADLGLGAGYTGRAGPQGGTDDGNMVERWLADSILYPLPALLTEGNPLVGMASVGQTMINYGGAAWLAGTGGALTGAVAGAVGGTAAGGPAGTAAGSLIGAALLSKLGGAAVVAGAIMIVEGAVLAYVIPMMPALLMVLAIIGWLVLVIEMLVAGPLLAAAHAFSDGQDFAPPQTRHGYSVAIGATMRPLLLTFGFIFAWLLMDVSGAFLGMALDVYLYSLVGSDVGFVALVSTVGVVAGGALTMVYFVMRLVVHLAQHVPMWLGGTSGTDLGADSAAQQAMQHNESRVTRPALAGGLAYGSKSAAGIGEDIRDARRGPEGGGKDSGGAGGGDNQETTTTTPAPQQKQRENGK